MSSSVNVKNEQFICFPFTPFSIRTNSKNSWSKFLWVLRNAASSANDITVVQGFNWTVKGYSLLLLNGDLQLHSIYSITGSATVIADIRNLF